MNELAPFDSLSRNRFLMHQRRGWPLVAILGLLMPGGCARDHSRITPTTSGTDLRTMPRGRMTPLPFPGSSLAHAGHLPPSESTPHPGRFPKLDPNAMPTGTRSAGGTD